MQITQSTPADIDTIIAIYSAAIRYQQEKGYNVWPVFEASFICKEIGEGRHYKILEDQQVACIFSIVYSDPVIWGERDKTASIYLHRIATHPSFKGKGIVKHIVEWAKEQGRRQHKQFIRMDTWGDNQGLTDYYIAQGFTYLGQQTIPKTLHLPAHYWNITINLFQIPLA